VPHIVAAQGQSIDVGVRHCHLIRHGSVSDLHAVGMKEKPKLLVIAATVKGRLLLRFVTDCKDCVESVRNRGEGIRSGISAEDSGLQLLHPPL
jgi:hypothetical protein